MLTENNTNEHLELEDVYSIIKVFGNYIYNPDAIHITSLHELEFKKYINQIKK